MTITSIFKMMENGQYPLDKLPNILMHLLNISTQGSKGHDVYGMSQASSQADYESCNFEEDNQSEELIID